MRTALITALAREGIPIEQAARILLAVFGREEPINLGQFKPIVMDSGYTIQCERFTDLLPRLHLLHLEHWQETEKYRHGLRMDPDYEAMKERERIGRLLQITCRTPCGELVGHLRLFIQTSLHTQTTYADEDTLFLQPEHRGGTVAIRMMRYGEACMHALGVREFRANSKLSNKADVLMRRLGYPAVATQFCKILPEEASDVQ